MIPPKTQIKMENKQVIEDKPTAQIEVRHRKPKKLPVFVSAEDLLAILKVSKHKHHKFAYMMGWYSGLRISEILNLEPRDIDMVKGTVFVRQGKGSKDGVSILCPFFREEMFELMPLKHIRKNNTKLSNDNIKIYGKNLTKNRYDNREIPIDKNYPINILYFKSFCRQNMIHPTQKPVALFEYLIITYTNEGDLVMDCVVGSGTTAVACKRTNRNFICNDNNQEYVKIANERLNQCVLENSKGNGGKDEN